MCNHNFFFTYTSKRAELLLFGYEVLRRPTLFWKHTRERIFHRVFHRMKVTTLILHNMERLFVIFTAYLKALFKYLHLTSWCISGCGYELVTLQNVKVHFMNVQVKEGQGTCALCITIFSYIVHIVRDGFRTITDDRDLSILRHPVSSISNSYRVSQNKRRSTESGLCQAKED